MTLLEVTGRPVTVLEGVLPMWRDFEPGIEGPDVLQLQEALARLGRYRGGPNERYDRQTGDCRAVHGGRLRPPDLTEERPQGCRRPATVSRTQNAREEAKKAQFASVAAARQAVSATATAVSEAEAAAARSGENQGTVDAASRTIARLSRQWKRPASPSQPP